MEESKAIIGEMDVAIRDAKRKHGWILDGRTEDVQHDASGAVEVSRSITEKWYWPGNGEHDEQRG